MEGDPSTGLLTDETVYEGVGWRPTGGTDVTAGVGGPGYAVDTGSVVVEAGHGSAGDPHVQNNHLQKQIDEQIWLQDTGNRPNNTHNQQNDSL